MIDVNEEGELGRDDRLSDEVADVGVVVVVVVVTVVVVVVEFP